VTDEQDQITMGDQALDAADLRSEYEPEHLKEAIGGAVGEPARAH
jgi:hypothetical protein